MADVKGDLSGIARPGADDPRVRARAGELGLDLKGEPCPTLFLDVWGVV